MDERSIEEQDHLERVISVEEDDDDSNLDMEELSDEFTSIPTVEVDREWKRNLRKPWRNAPIIKLLGKGSLDGDNGGFLEDYGSLSYNTKMEAELSPDYGNDCIHSSVDSIAWFTFGIFQ
ncbi:hypothetical protein GOBAR_DD05149 [Gossypium barbadense]|nr:hypothetical protein GOBAR_DD05149 [Gossypium barbadense]